MKLLAQYMERAESLEAMAADEPESLFKARVNQAAEYRRLAAKRARDYGWPHPGPPGAANSSAAESCTFAFATQFVWFGDSGPVAGLRQRDAHRHAAPPTAPSPA